MAVFRVHKNSNYTVMSNYHFRERGMSLKAKGLLSLMLSLPEDWDYSAAGLVTLSKDGKDSVNAALKELEKYGYLVRTQALDAGGKFSGYNYEIYENPTTENPQAETPSTDKPFAENPSTENPPQLNNKQLNTKKSITKKQSTKVKERKKETGYDAIISEMVVYEPLKVVLYEFIKMRKLIKKPLTDFALKKLINKLYGLSKAPADQVAIVERSILNNWQDVYELKETQQTKSAPRNGGGNPFLDLVNEDEANNVF